jgi:hypothetical protein
MLDDVERRRFLVDPARKDALPAAAGLLHIQLDERAGQFLIFPRRAGFAGAQADDRVLDLDRLARLQGQIAYDAVALVEEAQNRHPLGHRRHSDDNAGTRHIGANGCRARRFLGGIAITAARDKCDQQHGSHKAHAQSGFHA